MSQSLLSCCRPPAISWPLDETCEAPPFREGPAARVRALRRRNDERDIGVALRGRRIPTVASPQGAYRRGLIGRELSVSAPSRRLPLLVQTSTNVSVDLLIERHVTA